MSESTSCPVSTTVRGVPSAFGVGRKQAATVCGVLESEIWDRELVVNSRASSQTYHFAFAKLEIARIFQDIVAIAHVGVLLDSVACQQSAQDT